jgi:hypothetical protein
MIHRRDAMAALILLVFISRISRRVMLSGSRQCTLSLLILFRRAFIVGREA